MTIEIALLISIVSVAFSIFFGLKNSRKSDEKDIADRIARDTRTDMKLDEIFGMAELKTGGNHDEQ